jgi:acetyl esterase
LKALPAHADLGATGKLDPQIAEVLRMSAKAAQPHYWEIGAVNARRAYERAARVLEIRSRPVHRLDHVLIPGPGGGIHGRLSWPQEPSWVERVPVLLLLHGGGFTVGSAAGMNHIASMITMEARCAVLSIDYRLAPEHPFPAAYEDAWAALKWLHEEAPALGIDRDRIAVGGDSAGGTLAAACAIAARDAGLPLVLQWLVYPGTCAHQDTESHFRLGEGFLITRRTILWFFEQYISHPRDRDDWRFAPLEAVSLQGLAPAWVALAEFDPLVDEGVAYARRMAAEGTSVDLKLYAGMVHAFFNMGGFVKMARRAHADGVLALKRAFRIADSVNNSHN